MIPVIDYKSLKLIANEVYHFPTNGLQLIIKSIDAPVFVKFDGNAEIPVDAGMVLTFPSVFKTIVFRNSVATTNTVVFYVGTIIISRFLTLVSTKSQPTLIIGKQANLPGTVGNLACNGLDLANGRKQIVVSNASTVNDLFLVDSVGTTFDFIAPRAKWTEETSSYVKVVNPNVAAVQVYVAETWYL